MKKITISPFLILMLSQITSASDYESTDLHTQTIESEYGNWTAYWVSIHDSELGRCDSGVYVLPSEVRKNEMDLVTGFGTRLKDDQASNCQQRYEVHIFESNPERKHEFIPSYSKEWIDSNKIIILSDLGAILASDTLLDQKTETVIERANLLLEKLYSNNSVLTTPDAARPTS